MKAANEQAARAIKPAWFGAAGLSASSRVAGRKVSIRDDTTGTRNVTTIVRWQGPVHLVEGPTAPHVIGAKLLTTRSGFRNRARSGRIGDTRSINRGAFGALMLTRKTRRGIRDRRGARALTIGGNLRAYAFHPGTRGRGFWERNKADAKRIAPAVYRATALPSLIREAGFGR